MHRPGPLLTQRQGPLGFSCDRLRVSGGTPKGVCLRVCVCLCVKERLLHTPALASLAIRVCVCMHLLGLFA